MINMTVPDHRGAIRPAQIDRNPDTCPMCHRGIEPVDMKRDHLIFESPNVQRIERLLRCPREACQRLFIARYHLDPRLGYFAFVGSVPVELVDEKFIDEIKLVSGDFCDIYDESQKAEKSGLLLVAGPGYRKSLEFLVKDYLCARNPGRD
jgi:hypothetical protein